MFRALICSVAVSLGLLSGGSNLLLAQGNSTTAPGKAVNNVRMFQYNVWNEFGQSTADFNRFITNLIATQADVVALSEVRNYGGVDFTNKIVTALAAQGHAFHGTYIGGDMGLVSRYPVTGYKLIQPPSGDSGTLGIWYLQMPDGRTLAVASAHLDYTRYAVYLPRGYNCGGGGYSGWNMIDTNGDGVPDPVTDPTILNSVDQASRRDEGIAAFIAHVNTLPPDTPCLLLGDFNEASHLDWTDAMKNLYSHNGVVMSWTNSQTLAAANFGDSWREIYPNPVTHPGMTWPSNAYGKGNTSWTPKADERDRIDFVYYRKNSTLTPTLARIPGSIAYYSSNGTTNVLVNDTTSTPFCLTANDWTSDHKGVLVDLAVNQSARIVPTVTFSAASQSAAAESGTLTVTAQLSSTTTLPVTVPFSITGTATNGADFTVSSSPLTIPAGSSTATATISITPDALTESAETVILTMGNPTNALAGLTTVHTATIPGNTAPPAPTITTASPNAAVQGATITMALTGTNFSTGSTARLTRAGNADIAGFNTTITSATSMTSSFVLAGAAVGQWNVVVTSAVGLSVTLTNGFTVSVPTATVSPAKAVYASGENIVINFQNAPGNAKDWIGIYAPGVTPKSGSPALKWLYVNGSQTSGAAGITSGALTFNGGLATPGDYVAFLLQNDGYTILAQTAFAVQPTVQFTAPAQSSAGESGSLTVTVQLSSATSLPVTVPFTVAGSASSGTDFILSASPITIAAGATTGTATLSILADTVYEGGETVILTMGAPTNALLGGVTTHTASITDDDPQVSFTHWQNGRFSLAEISAGATGPEADFDGDGLKNLVEYALDTDPKAPSAPPAAHLDATGLWCEFTRPQGGRPDLSYAGESSSNLVNWQPALLEIVQPGDPETVRVRDPLNDNPSSKFIHLRVTRN